MAENNNDLGASFMDNFSCKICLEILHDPVQCRNNEHYFCRKCITKHLMENSETCPLCMDQLTLETLRPPSRIILDIISQMRRPRCRHVARGCTENVAVAEVLLHQETCGFAPVVCSNEGCKETVNRRDKESHETEECKFRKITCESCSEEMVYGDYEKHQCTLRREMNEVKARLDEVEARLDKRLDEVIETLKQMAATQTEVSRNLKSHDQSIKDLQDPLRRASSTTIPREGTVVVSGQIFVFGGSGGYGKETNKSLEVFNWSTKTWTLVKNCLFFNRRDSYSFPYGKRIMVCGGSSSNRIEFLDPSESGFTSCVFPGSLPCSGVLNATLFGNRLITFSAKVEETLLESPWGTRTLVEKNYTGNGRCGVECFGNDIFVVGDSKVERYNTARNELNLLPSLPYSVVNMATVAYKDNIIILGGQSSTTSLSPLNNVLIYNTNSLECKRLPSMLEKRSHCAAVVMGDVIVVMGGVSKDKKNIITYLNTVEYYVFGENTWQELPSMNLPRSQATACVYV